MEFPAVLNRILAGSELSRQEISESLGAILGGKWEHAQVAAFLIAMRSKGETPNELAAAADVLRAVSVPVETDDSASLVDTCGTGGDNSNTFNISTAAAFTAAAAGVRIAKHGNRAQSGVCGSSDLIAALGSDLHATPAAIASCLDLTGICFMFAPAHHPAMKAVGPVRAALGVRTMFNLLGPMLNPAGVVRQVVGVFAGDLIEPYAQALAQLGCQRALVVNAQGLDEFSVCGPSSYAELAADGSISLNTITPADAGLEQAKLADLQISDKHAAIAMFESIISGARSPAADACALNAGAAIYVAGQASGIADGCQAAQQALASGAVQAKVDEFKKFFAST